MFDARQGTRRSPRRVSLEGSENECEGNNSIRLSIGSASGVGGPCTPAGKQQLEQQHNNNPDAARSPLTSADNGAPPPPPPVAPTQQASSSALTPSKVKPPTAPGVSRFGFKPPPAGSLSPRARPASSSTSTGGGGGPERGGGDTMGTTSARARSALPSMMSPSRTAGNSNSSSSGSSGSGRSRSTTARPVTGTTRTAAGTSSTTRPRSTRAATAAAAAAAGGSSGYGARQGATATRARTTRSGVGAAVGSRDGRANGGRAASGTAAPSSRRLSHKLSQPIAVSGRMTRTATKVKPRLEVSGRAAGAGGGVTGAGSMASPASARAKRNAGAPGTGSRRLHKSPRTSIDRDYTPSRSRTPAPESRGGIRVHAQRIFTISDDEVEEILKTKVKGASKWDYKTRIQNQNELVAKLRTMLNNMLQQKHRFKDACIDTEAALKAEIRKVTSRSEDVERDHVELLDENARFHSVEAGLKADLKLAKEERALLRAENEKLVTKADSLRDGLSRAEGDLLKLEAKVADGEARTGEAETQLAMAREKLAWAEAQSGAQLAQKEQEWEARMDTATSGAHQEVAVLAARLEGKDLELESIKEDNGDMMQKTADLREELAMATGRAKEAEALLERARADLNRLDEGQRRAQSALDAKNLEMSSTLSTFAKSQMAADEREAELKNTRRTLESRLASVEAEKSTLATQLSTREAGVASLTAEINLLKEQLMNASKESSEFRAELVESRMIAQQATEALTVEKQARLRAETKEEDERRERISTTAQMAAVQQQHSREMEAERVARVKLETESTIRVQSATEEKAGLCEKLVLGEERQLELEAEVRGLKAAVVDAQTNAEQLEEMSRAQGELEVLRHRMEALAREKESVAVGASAKVDELEAKVLEGELQRRKMHNLIQELRGNVRVFARVRPFLPSDGVGPEEVPAVVGKGDGVGCVVSKRLVGDDGKELAPEVQSFSFDKCFPPSAGQEEVFTEVSEFVQSALDGFNVCLFSYGQTGSGKTHTMQGSGAGDMRGMIPRAMEQVGKYKTKLETQGWEYEMQVSFLEIYNEQIRDLLRDEGSKDVKHEIKRDPRGNTTVTDLTMERVDPNDGAGVDEIMQRAACHRSVGRTDMNERSSRSHSVFTLYLKAVNQQQRSSLKGTLHLVDLAGSERLSRSNATGDRLKETVAINKSLSSLTDVFVSISNKSSHIPFRNSKLTYLLQPALSGDGKTLMMVNLSPTDQSYHESLCSLRFASQVNQCELGRPKRQLRDMGSSDGGSSAQKSTAGSSRKGATSTTSRLR